MKEKLTSIIKYPIVMVFGAFVLVMFALYLVLPDNDFSDVENRNLQTMPSVSFSSLGDGSYMTKFETYTTEQLPFREALVKVKALIKQMTLSNENNGIVRGKDDYLFEVSYGLSGQYGKNVAAIKKFSSDLNRPVSIAIAPTATGILTDHVPKGFKTIDQKAEIDKLRKNLTESTLNVNFVDLYDTIEAHAKSSEQMYYRTDHHWTSLAAYYAYEEIVDEPIELDSLIGYFTDDFYGTHFAKFKEFNIKPDTLTYYDIPIVSLERSDGTYDSLYDLEKLKIYDKYAMFMHGNDDLLTVNAKNFVESKEEDSAGRSVIVFKDSYANCLIPYLTYNYDTITVVDLRYYSDSVADLLNSNEDADILLLYNFDFINEDNHFYRLTS